MKWIIVMLLFSGNVIAASCGENKKNDRRILYVDFGKDKTYNIQGGAKQPTVFVFDKHERVLWADCGGCDKGQSVGDIKIPPGWLITTSADQRRLNIRPQYPGSSATVNVETTKGRFYTFEMRASKHASRHNKYNTRRAHFCYPEQERKRKEEIDKAKYEEARRKYEERVAEIKRRDSMNKEYDWDGKSPIAPIAVRDDGKFTEFVFGENTPSVAIYRVDVDGYDISTNPHIEGNTVVVHSVAAQFTLRRGKHTLCVFNRKMRPIAKTTQRNDINVHEKTGG